MKSVWRTVALLAACAIGCVVAGGARAGATHTVTIGVLNDMSGVYADFQGIGSVVSAQLAAEDFEAANPGWHVRVLSGDHQNKPDVGAAIARRWLDEDGVDAIADLPNSAVALAISTIVREKNKALLASGAGTEALTGAQCSPNTVQWTFDTWELGHSMGRAVVASGGKRWFFVTADYTFGIALQKSTTEAVEAAGGTVLGSTRHPLGASDLSSYLLQAQASGADVLGLADAGGDTDNAMKQASEFGLTKTMRIAGIIANIGNIRGVGLANAQGMLVATPFYWDMNDGTRAFARRYSARHPRHQMPNDMQAGVYAVALHYLKAAKAVGGASDGRAVVDAMKQMPAEDPLFGKTVIRVDGRALHPIYLMQTKAPAESHGAWDLLKEVAVVPAEQAFRTLADGHCPFVTQ
jgi:branched-chain amino acid transport system substrate-binding protein